MSAPPKNLETADLMEFGYTNYRGEKSVRRVIPGELFFGYSPYHVGKQWFLRAYDVDKEQTREFAFADIRPGEVPDPQISID